MGAALISSEVVETWGSRAGVLCSVLQAGMQLCALASWPVSASVFLEVVRGMVMLRGLKQGDGGITDRLARAGGMQQPDIAACQYGQLQALQILDSWVGRGMHSAFHVRLPGQLTPGCTFSW
jgi:hypothetical protein